MQEQDYQVSITVDARADQAFDSINSVSDWWTTLFEGQSEKLDDIFTVRFGETFITVKIVDFIANSKIVWRVIDCYKHWIKNKKEWLDTTMSWEILYEAHATQIRFTHIGLVPGIECYNGCENAWNFYIKESLFKLLTEGKGKPELK
jgi:hypothetical protein